MRQQRDSKASQPIKEQSQRTAPQNSITMSRSSTNIMVSQYLWIFNLNSAFSTVTQHHIINITTISRFTGIDLLWFSNINWDIINVQTCMKWLTSIYAWIRSRHECCMLINVMFASVWKMCVCVSRFVVSLRTSCWSLCFLDLQLPLSSSSYLRRTSRHSDHTQRSSLIR